VLLRSQRIICPEGIRAGEVAVEDGRISSVGPPRRGRAGRGPAGAGELIELGDRWLVPGYIDTHVHGGGGGQFNTSSVEEIDGVARFHCRHGTTGLLATTVPASLEELCAALAAIARCTAPNLLGAHLEGPFLSPEHPGALDPSRFLGPDAEQLDRLLAAAPHTVRIMTLAPELSGGCALVKRLTRAGVVASLGHSAATYAEARDAVSAGATAATHLFNAMLPFHHHARSAVGAALDLPELSCELICDGVHVDPVAMRLVYRLKGPLGVRLVTDAMAAAGLPDGNYRLGGQGVTVTGGSAVLEAGESLAGSTLTMDAAVRNAVRLLDLPVEDAVRMAAANPARLLGLPGRKGAIATGLDADLLVLGERLDVEAVMVAGHWLAGQP
jgi:N-acetylglucosamine-6-phosphate deacetylase